MSVWLKSNSGSFGTWPYNISENPCPTICSKGIGGRSHSQYWIEEDGKKMKVVSEKPKYKVPSMAEISDIPPNGYKVISTFSGAGGSCLGYRMSGFDVIWANEFVPAAQESYKANAAPDCYLDCRDIREVMPEEILMQTGLKSGELDVFDGSPPCQAFSTAGKREKGWGKEKKYEHGASQCNENLFFEYIRLLRGLKPRVFVAENVSGLLKGTAKGMFIEIMRELKASGYNVKCRLLDAQWLGVPQKRKRAIFIGIRNDIGREPVFPAPLKYRYSVSDVLPHLSEYVITHPSGFKQGKADSLQKPCRTIMARSEGLGSSGPGQSFLTNAREKRKFTIDEVKRICSFPDDFILKGNYSQQWERLGNSVPPVMMCHIASKLFPVLLQNK